MIRFENCTGAAMTKPFESFTGATMINSFHIHACEMEWLPPPAQTEELPVGLIEDQV